MQPKENIEKKSDDPERQSEGIFEKKGRRNGSTDGWSIEGG